MWTARETQLGNHGFQTGELNNGRKLKSSSPSGLALIESFYFRAGPETARDQFQRLLGPDQSVRPFAFVRRGPALNGGGHCARGRHLVREF